jgi:hypothetical protein
MAFNEINCIEHYIIKQLTDTNLNKFDISEPKELYYDSITI